jgi:site-specific DNA recombinase
MIERLSRPDAAAVLSPPEKGDLADGLRTEEQSLRSRLNGLAEAFAVGDIDAQQLRTGSKRLRDRLQSISQQLSTLARAPAVSGLLSSPSVREASQSLDLDTQREEVASTWSGLARGCARVLHPDMRVSAPFCCRDASLRRVVTGVVVPHTGYGG